MATPPDIALADELVTELTERWPGQIVAERTWVPDWECRTELDTLRVAVQPGPDPSGELTERDQIWEVWPIDIGFAQRLQQRTRQEIDDLVGLVDEVRQFLQLAAVDLADGRHFQCLGFETLARFDPTLLDRQLVGGNIVYAGTFLSVIRFPFQRFD